jgi:hypothetical protein
VRPGTATPAPPPSQSSNPNVSRKPASNSGFDSAAVTAKKKEEGKVAYQKANPTYKAPNGQEVKIDPNEKSTQTVRNLPKEEVKNYSRRQDDYYRRTYGDRYEYYRTQPVVVVGHYSSPFWYSTYDWDASRQALWLYHNQMYIDTALWQQRMANAAVAAEVARLQAQGVARNPNYVDPAFANNPQYMYDANYVQAAAKTSSSSRGGWWCLWTAVILGVIVFAVWFIGFRQHDNNRYE